MSTTTLDAPPRGGTGRAGGLLDGSAAARLRSAHPAVATLTDAVEALAEHLDALDGWTAVDALLAVEGLAGRLAAVSARLLAQVEADGLWATAGGRSVTDWLAVSAGLAHHQARDRVALARALRDHLPVTAAAVLAGDVPVAQAQTLARYAVTTQARRDALAAPDDECGEGFLLAHAAEQTADGFRTVVRRWAAAADPEADERGYREASEREFLVLAPTTGGVHVAGFLTTEHGAAVGAALQAVTTPPAPDDERTAQQRRASALVEVARLVLDHGLTGTGLPVRPHVNVVVDFEKLRRAVGEGFATGVARGDGAGSATGPARVRGSAPFRLAPVADVERFAVAEIVGTGPIPAPVLARLACDGEVSRIVFGPESQVINAGRAERVFSGARRRAIVARDRTCRYPGCNAPPALGELHHISWWSRDGGETDANDGILLCWHHHEVVHARDIVIARSATGGWVFSRYGEQIVVR